MARGGAKVRDRVADRRWAGLLLHRNWIWLLHELRCRCVEVYSADIQSYNQKHSNAVMDAILICGSNVLFENFAAFAVFGVVGYLRRWPQDGVRLGAFVVGFLTLPEAVLQMPGANFWAVLLFATLIILGFSSAFVMLDVTATLLVDSGLRYSRPTIVTGLTLLCFLMCLPYCTQFGYYLLDGIDRWVNNVALIFVAWSEVVSATTVYRCSDVIGQTGLPAFVTYQVAYFGAHFLGIALAHGTGSPGIGAGAGIGFFAVGTIIAGAIAVRTPGAVPAITEYKETSETLVGKARIAMKRFGSNVWYLAFYSVSFRLVPSSSVWCAPRLTCLGQPVTP
jgi:solute carrier family 6 GABA transporter-like protein 1